MSELLSLRALSERANMSQAVVRRFLPEVPHFRNKPKGKIYVKWEDFISFIDRRRTAIRADNDVRAILADLRAARG